MVIFADAASVLPQEKEIAGSVCELLCPFPRAKGRGLGRKQRGKSGRARHFVAKCVAFAGLIIERCALGDACIVHDAQSPCGLNAFSSRSKCGFADRIFSDRIVGEQAEPKITLLGLDRFERQLTRVFHPNAPSWRGIATDCAYRTCGAHFRSVSCSRRATASITGISAGRAFGSEASGTSGASPPTSSVRKFCQRMKM